MGYRLCKATVLLLLEFQNEKQPMHDVWLPLQILTEIAHSLGYAVTCSDDVSKTVLRVASGGKHFFAGIGKIGMYPLNSHFSAVMAHDKAWSYQALTQAGFRVPKGKHFFITDDWQEYRPKALNQESAVAYANELGYPVFAKPNDGSSGLLAELIHDPNALKAHLMQIKKVSGVALVQEYINLPEYRIFVVDDHVEFVYQRTKPFLVGDGTHTIFELLTIMNKHIPIERHRIALNSEFLRHELQRCGYQTDTVLKSGIRFYVTAHANLASGGEMIGVTTQVPDWLHIWAARVIKTLGLRVAGIDVFSAEPLLESRADDNIIIIELNSNPNLAGIYEHGHVNLAQIIWKKILLKFFE